MSTMKLKYIGSVTHPFTCSMRKVHGCLYQLFMQKLIFVPHTFYMN